MGLDMYLEKHYYVRNWEHNPPSEHWAFTITKGGQPSPIDTAKIVEVNTLEVYWRKANQIHRWFVEHVQGGKDDCQESEVSREQLSELLQAVKDVLAHHDKAEALLPVQEGFFFGSTAYDKAYFDDLKDTEKELTRLLATPLDGGYFVYRASW